MGVPSMGCENPCTSVGIGTCGAHNCASKTSNECIECETTAYQGIDHTTNECVRCDEATQFFDKITKKCISKTSLNRIDGDAMKKCYGCPNNETFKECAILFSKSENARRASANYDEIIRDCYIKE